MAYIEYFDRHSGLKSPSLEGDVPSLEAYALVHLCISKAIFLRCTSINYISEAIFHGRTIMHDVYCSRCSFYMLLRKANAMYTSRSGIFHHLTWIDIYVSSA